MMAPASETHSEVPDSMTTLLVEMEMAPTVVAVVTASVAATASAVAAVVAASSPSCFSVSFASCLSSRLGLDDTYFHPADVVYRAAED